MIETVQRSTLPVITKACLDRRLSKSPSPEKIGTTSAVPTEQAQLPEFEPMEQIGNVFVDPYELNCQSNNFKIVIPEIFVPNEMQETNSHFGRISEVYHETHTTPQNDDGATVE